MTNMKNNDLRFLIPNQPMMHHLHVLAEICGSTSAEDGYTHPNAYWKRL